MSRAGLVLALVALLAQAAVAGCKKEGPPAESREQILARTLPAVVLLIARRPDGKLGYGSGVVIDHRGTVLTSLHVVAGADSLSAMLYDPARVSYTPMDGGLGRYIFENGEALVAARLVRGDPRIDVAVVHIEADTMAVPLIPPSPEAPARGQAVISLGHPQETVWSYTSGSVSALHQGAIQHDAAVNQGNSGGPLLDGRGRLIGINTSKVMGNADGVAFARPIGIAMRVAAEATAELTVDQSTPERAFTTCMRASELASAAFGDCIDFDAFIAAMVETSREEEAKGTMAKGMADGLLVMGRGPLLAQMKQGVLDTLRADEADAYALVRNVRGQRLAVDEVRPDAPVDRDAFVKAFNDAVAEFDARKDTYPAEAMAKWGIKIDVFDPVAMREVQKMGTRIAEARAVGFDRAWLLIEGRNLDGTPYRHASFLRKEGERWLMSLARDVDLAALPAGWPPPLLSYADMKHMFRVGVLAEMSRELRAPD